MKKNISVITPTFNEEENIEEVYRQVAHVMGDLPGYDYEHIFIDNASHDLTVSILRGIAARDKRVKIIVNARNFGHIRSPLYAMLQAQGDAVILIVADLQDPVPMILDFVKKWEEGYKVVLGIKNQSRESFLFFFVRKFYYNLIHRLSEIDLPKNNTGFGLYDRYVMDVIRKIDDPYPYFRGLVADLGFESFKCPYIQPVRKRGFTKNNLYTLYDMAMTGITNHTKVPLRLATLFGFFFSLIFLAIGFLYLLYKILFWDRFSVGIAPIVIGFFLFAAIQLFFIGVIGEYVGAVFTQVQKRPLVIEKERINFD
jgi:glycosyltransferase involved in cell wall biosynthesis